MTPKIQASDLGWSHWYIFLKLLQSLEVVEGKERGGGRGRLWKPRV